MIDFVVTSFPHYLSFDQKSEDATPAAVAAAVSKSKVDRLDGLFYTVAWSPDSQYLFYPKITTLPVQVPLSPFSLLSLYLPSGHRHRHRLTPTLTLTLTLTPLICHSFLSIFFLPLSYSPLFYFRFPYFTNKPMEVYRHKLQTEQSSDELIWRDMNVEFSVDVDVTTSGRYILIIRSSCGEQEEWL